MRALILQLREMTLTANVATIPVPFGTPVKRYKKRPKKREDEEVP